MTALQGAGVPVSDIRQTIGGIVQTVLDRDVEPSVDVFDQGATSLAFIRIVAEVNERYGITLDVAELEEASVDALSGLTARQLGQSPNGEGEGLT
jgi:acyl carrier protein